MKLMGIPRLKVKDYYRIRKTIIIDD